MRSRMHNPTIKYVNKYRNLRTQQMLVHSLVCIFPRHVSAPIGGHLQVCTNICCVQRFLYLLIDTRTTGCINQLRIKYISCSCSEITRFFTFLSFLISLGAERPHIAVEMSYKIMCLYLLLQKTISIHAVIKTQFIKFYIKSNSYLCCLHFNLMISFLTS
jgi:hypothetical protein